MEVKYAPSKEWFRLSSGGKHVFSCGYYTYEKYTYSISFYSSFSRNRVYINEFGKIELHR